MSSTWVALTKNDMTWRQATEGWAVVLTFIGFATLGATFFQVARRLFRSKR